MKHLATLLCCFFVLQGGFAQNPLFLQFGLSLEAARDYLIAQPYHFTIQQKPRGTLAISGQSYQFLYEFSDDKLSQVHASEIYANTRKARKDARGIVQYLKSLSGDFISRHGSNGDAYYAVLEKHRLVEMRVHNYGSSVRLSMVSTSIDYCKETEVTPVVSEYFPTYAK